jgi:hypothetical protein
MATTTDRRRRIRVPVEQKIRHSRYQVLGTPVFEENSALDLSTNGISFVTAQEYRKGDLILLEVGIDGEILKLLVCIAWVKKVKGQIAKFNVGAELIAIDPEHKKQMQSHLSKLIQKYSVKKTKKKTTTKKTTKKKTAIKKSSASKRKTAVKETAVKKTAVKKPTHQKSSGKKKSVKKKKKSRTQKTK